MFKRVFLIVLDSLGIGAMEDAKNFGDEGSNTLLTINFTLNKQPDSILFITLQTNAALSISNSSIHFSSLCSTPGHLISAYGTLLLSNTTLSSSSSSSSSIHTLTNTPMSNSDTSTSSEYRDICLYS